MTKKSIFLVFFGKIDIGSVSFPYTDSLANHCYLKKTTFMYTQLISFGCLMIKSWREGPFCFSILVLFHLEDQRLWMLPPPALFFSELHQSDQLPHVSLFPGLLDLGPDQHGLIPKAVPKRKDTIRLG
jgi:hypothetical protein